MATNGCLNYQMASVDIAFSVDSPDKVCCSLCPLMETYARKQCRRTGEYIVDDRNRGFWCPLVIKDLGGEE